MGDSPWYAERSVVASAAVLVVIVVIGGAVLLTGDPGSGSSPAARAPQGAETGGSVCGLAAGSQDPVVGSPEARWALVGKIAAPSAPGVGPGIVNAKERRCFAHSPTGAVFAAANWLATAGLHGDDDDVMRQITARNRVREVYLRQPGSGVDPAFRVQVAGFQTRVVDHDAMVVRLALQTNTQGRMADLRLPLRWESGDWRVVLESLQEPLQISVIPSLLGYVRWGGA